MCHIYILELIICKCNRYACLHNSLYRWSFESLSINNLIVNRDHTRESIVNFNLLIIHWLVVIICVYINRLDLLERGWCEGTKMGVNWEWRIRSRGLWMGKYMGKEIRRDERWGEGWGKRWSEERCGDGRMSIEEGWAEVGWWVMVRKEIWWGGVGWWVMVRKERW